MKYIIITTLTAISLSSCTMSYTQSADGGISLDTMIVPIPVDDWKK